MATPRKAPFKFAAKSLTPDSASYSEVYKLQALLARYGFLDGAYHPGRYDAETRKAVAEFQSYYKIYPDVDGVADARTIEIMSDPRCGVLDSALSGRFQSGRLAAFVTVNRWEVTALRYRFLNTTPDLTGARQRDILGEAFQHWSAVSALQFREVADSEESEISIAFHRGSHGDGNPFDNLGGPDSNTLAHAFFPPPNGGRWAGALHFDEFELWKDRAGGAGARLYTVALHEIGHLLGLAHSRDRSAIMFPYYGEDRDELEPDDVAAIQSLYGAPVGAAVALAPGERVVGSLPQAGAEVQYQITLQNKLLIRLEGMPGNDYDLYVRRGAPAGAEEGSYDVASYGTGPTEVVSIDNPAAGTYYVLVRSFHGSGEYTIEVEVN